MNILTPSDCTGCKMNSRTLDGGTDDQTFCSRLDMIRDVPFLTPCPENCCNSPVRGILEDVPFGFYLLVVLLLGLVIASTLSLVLG